MYRIIAGRKKRYIDPASAEGVRITDDIAAANTIMRDVRPQWKDPGKQRGRKANPSTAQPGTPIEAQPASSSREATKSSTILSRPTHIVSTRDSNAGTIPSAVVSKTKITRSTSKTTAALPIPATPPAVVPQRTTRITSNTTVTVPVAFNSEISGGLSTITTAIVPTTPISRTVRCKAPNSLEANPFMASSSEASAITRSAAVPVTPNSRRTQDKRGILKVIDDNLDQDQSMEDSRNHSTATEDSDSDELRTEDSESDDSDDYARGEIPSVDEPSSNNLALDIVPYTSGDNSVVEPTCRSNLASILQKTGLFNESELRWQQKDLVSEAILMRQPYRSRKPSVQNVLPNPSSLKLPETNGPIIVEQLMQLGERFQWITQKDQALKGYLRALDEHLLLTMLGVEQLFDSRYLKCLFKGRRSGAGICTKRLMDKIEAMVRKSIDNSKAGDSRDETFQFNAQEILGSQYQPKFCVSVEVTIKPYDGENEYLHMAQHFQEVRNIFPSKQN